LGFIHAGYKSFERLKNLEILDISENGVNNTVLPFINTASSLKTLILHGNNMEGTFPMKGTYVHFQVLISSILRSRSHS